MIKGHGDDGYLYPGIRINFSSNIHPLGISNPLAEHLKGCLSNIGSYPEPLAESLANRIRQRRNLADGSVLVTNGSVEALYLSAAWTARKRSLVYLPSFAEYTDACRACGHDLVFLDNTSFPDIPAKGIHAVWIGNPNNPDGKIFEHQLLYEQIRRYPEILFIVDEAYHDFAESHDSLAEEACRLPNLIVTNSFTKRYAMPGIRLGYLVSHPDRIRKMEQQIMPWRINNLAIEAGLFCLSEKYRDEFDMHELLKESQRVQTAINNIGGFQVYSSGTTFFLVRGPVNAAYLKQVLACDHHMLIRDASNFQGLSEYHFRISVQSPEENDILIDILKKWN